MVIKTTDYTDFDLQCRAWHWQN